MLKVTNVWVHKYTSGKLLGFADVQFSLDGGDTGQMVWKGFKVFQSQEGGIQIGLPQKKDEKGEKDENGKPKYHPIITLVKEEDGGPGLDLYESIRSAVEQAYYRKESPKGTKTPQGGNGGTGEVGDDDIPF